MKQLAPTRLTKESKLIVEIVATRHLRPDGAGNSVTFGFGGEVMENAIGLSDKGVFVRTGWATTHWALAADGQPWNDFGKRDVVALRSVWDVGAGTASCRHCRPCGP